MLALRALGARVDGRPRRGAPAARPPATGGRVHAPSGETNPELAAARERGLPVVHRAQALAALTAGRRLAAVTGTAGKTSTTSMLTVALQHCGLDPSFAIGGDLAASGSGRARGQRRRVRRRGRRERRRRSWRSPRTSRWSPTSRPTTSTTTARAAAYVAVFGDVPRPDRARRRAGRPARTTPAPRRWPPTAEARGIRVLRYGRAAGGRRPAARLPAGRRRRPGACCATPGVEHRAAARRARRAHGAQRAGRAAGRRRAGRATARACSRGWPRSTACGAGSSSAAAPPGSRSTTTTPTTRPRSPPSCAPPATSPAARAGCVVAFQPHLYSRTRDVRRRRSARRWGWPTRSWCWTSTAPARTPSPGVSGALVADAVPLPRRAGALRAALGGRAGGGGRAGPPRRPGDHHGRRRRHRAGARRSCWSWSGGSGCDPAAGPRAGPAARAPTAAAAGRGAPRPPRPPAVYRRRRSAGRRRWSARRAAGRGSG